MLISGILLITKYYNLFLYVIKRKFVLNEPFFSIAGTNASMLYTFTGLSQICNRMTKVNLMREKEAYICTDISPVHLVRMDVDLTIAVVNGDKGRQIKHYSKYRRK